LSDLTAIRQRHSETVLEYLKRFRETRNRRYNLTIGEKDLADLAFAGLSSYLKEKLEGQDFVDVNQVLQRAVMQENRARDHRLHGRFKESTFMEMQNVDCVNEELASDKEAEVCVAEWVDTPRDKLIFCSFLKPNAVKTGEMKFTFDVSKCDRLFDVLVKGGVIRLVEGHVIPTADVFAKWRYCKWHNSYSHSTNECNYFYRQVQSAINDGRLTFGDRNKMKLDGDPFLMNVVELEWKKILVQTDQAESTKGKGVVISDELRHRMIKPRSPEVDAWKENVRGNPIQRVKPTSNMLIEKYVKQQQRSYPLAR
jgi:hypothetical protein